MGNFPDKHKNDVITSIGELVSSLSSAWIAAGYFFIIWFVICLVNIGIHFFIDFIGNKLIKVGSHDNIQDIS